jgi:ABC-type branched-subunit amino acid transport system substrate-binding protein
MTQSISLILLHFLPRTGWKHRPFAKYLLANRPNAKIGTIAENGDAGHDYLLGLKEGLGDKASTMIVKEVAYEPSDPTVDSQIVKLKASGADTLYTTGTPKYVAQAIRKVAELGWTPFNYVVSVASSIKGVLEPAGIENSKGIMTTLAFKTPTDPRWQDSVDVKEFRQFLKDWMPNGDIADSNLVTGYVSAFMTVKVFEMCGKDLTRDNAYKRRGSAAASRHHHYHASGYLYSLFPNADGAFRRHELGSRAPGPFDRRRGSPNFSWRPLVKSGFVVFFCQCYRKNVSWQPRSSVARP